MTEADRAKAVERALRNETICELPGCGRVIPATGMYRYGAKGIFYCCISHAAEGLYPYEN